MFAMVLFEQRDEHFVRVVVPFVRTDPRRVWWRLRPLRKWRHERVEEFSAEIRERAVRMVQEHRGKALARMRCWSPHAPYPMDYAG